MKIVHWFVNRGAIITISGELEKAVNQKNCLENDHFVLDIFGGFKKARVWLYPGSQAEYLIYFIAGSLVWNSEGVCCVLIGVEFQTVTSCSCTRIFNLEGNMDRNILFHNGCTR